MSVFRRSATYAVIVAACLAFGSRLTFGQGTNSSGQLVIAAAEISADGTTLFIQA
jgi:hypothetical protein